MKNEDVVTVTVDRPLGSSHPKYKDLYYPINYGYIKGVIAEMLKLKSSQKKIWR